MTTYTPEEQAANRAKWVAALRSGQYQQTTGMLRGYDNVAFCCLGVACEVAAVDGIVEWVEQEETEGYREIGSTFLATNEVLPAAVVEWLGLAASASAGDTVERHSDRDIESLAELNDELKWDFNRIADLIEANGVVLAEATS